MRYLVIALLLFPLQNYANDAFTEIRKNLALAPDNKSICFNMINTLEPKKSDNKALAYLGAYTMIKANHQLNPLKKLASFNDGKKLLEKAIQQTPNDVELRYIRYAIQISIPKFLGYSTHILDDRKILEQNTTTTNVALQKDIKELLKVK